MNIYPAILTGNTQQAQEQVLWASSLEKVRTVHIDVIDGQFINNVTITPADLPEIDMGEVSCDLHFMTEEPLDFVYEAIEHRKEIPIRGIIGQVERMSYQAHFIEAVKKHSWEVGLAVDLFTPLEEIDEKSWISIDSLLILAIEAGWQGKTFHPGVLDKVQQALEIRRRYQRQFEVIVDGGIKAEQLKQLTTIGVDSVVVGSGLWETSDLQLAFTALHE